jgi:CubicO group peptidase (beta-lactamase class C family)
VYAQEITDMKRYQTVARLFLASTLTILFLSLGRSSAVARAASAAPSTPDFAAIDTYIEGRMRELRVPGLALGIVQGDQIVHLQGFGMADPSGRAVTPQTPFLIFSSTKFFTALAIMQLVEAGKIELDAPVQRYLPWFRVADPDASAGITVRHLLNHTSGLPETADTDVGLKTSTDTIDSALEQTLRGLLTVSLDRPVGAAFAYVNANYVTLGLIVQTVSGQTYESYVQEHVFVPLDMRQSFTAKAAAQPHGLAMGYQYWFGQPFPADLAFNRSNLPAGGLISSAEDMTHYLIAQLNQGRYGEASTLSPKGVADMHAPAVRRRGDQFYGMGWYVVPFNGAPVIWHGGDGMNFHSTMILAPEGQWGVVLLENAQNVLDGGDRMHQTAFGVISLLAGRQPAAAGSNNVFQLILLVIVGIIALMVIGMIRSIVVLRRWRTQPGRRPQGRRGIVWHVVLPLVLQLALALLFLIGLPQVLFQSPLPLFFLWLPDYGYTLLIGGLVALGWGILRTVLAYVALRTPVAPRPVTVVAKA